MKHFLTALILTVLLCFTLLSCSVHQQLYVRQEGTGVLNMRIDLSPMLVDYLTDLAEIRGGGAGEVRLFDVGGIKETIDGMPDLTLLSAQTQEDEEGVLITSVLFNNIKQAFHENLGNDIKPAGRLVDQGEQKILELYLDRDNYSKIVERFITLSSLDEFGPYVTALLEPGPEETIVEMYEYAFEEYTEGKTVKQQIEGSRITLDVYIDGEIADYSAGKKLDGIDHFPSGIRLAIPLIEILTLDRPLRYSIPFIPGEQHGEKK